MRSSTRSSAFRRGTPPRVIGPSAGGEAAAGGVGMGEDGSAQSGQQTSALTMGLFVAAGLGFILFVSQEPTEVVAGAPGPESDLKGPEPDNVLDT